MAARVGQPPDPSHRRAAERSGRRPPPGRGGKTPGSHQPAAHAGSRAGVLAAAGGRFSRGRDQSRADPAVTVWPGEATVVKRRRSPQPIGQTLSGPRPELAIRKGENWNQLAWLRLHPLKESAFRYKNFLDIFGNVFDHLCHMEFGYRFLNRSYKNHL